MKNQTFISKLVLTVSLLVSTFTNINAQAPVAWSIGINSTTSSVGYFGAVDMGTLSGGHTIIVGGYEKTSAYSGIKLSRVTSAGTIFSSAVFANTQPGNDYPAAMAIDNSNNIYVVGTVYYNAIYGYDMVLLKYNSALVLQWSRYIYGTGTSADYGQAIALDPSGNIFVTGSIANRGTSTGSDIVVSKFNSAGTQLWTEYYTGPGTGNDKPADIKTDASGNAYVCGKSFSSALYYSFLALKYNAAGGTPAWTTTLDLITTGTPATIALDEATSLAVNASGVYVTGGLTTLPNAEDIYLAKLSLTTGTVTWSKRYGSAGSANDRGVKVCLDNAGNVYLGGQCDYFSSISQDISLRKYSASGTLLWTNFINDTDLDIIKNMKVSSVGTIYITGKHDNFMLNQKYNTNGVLQWIDQLNWGVGLLAEVGTCIAIDESRSTVHFGGYRNSSTREWEIRKFNPTLKIAEETNETNDNLQVDVYPNPTTDMLNINAEVQNGNVQLYSIAGQLVKEAVINDSKAQITVTDLPRGSYLVRVTADNKTVSKKVIVR